MVTYYSNMWSDDMPARIEPDEWLKPELYDDPLFRGEPYNHETACSFGRPKHLRSAAILYKDRIWTGDRHCNIIRMIHEDLGGDTIPYDKQGEIIHLSGDCQGFLTDNNIFAWRPAATAIARKGGQLPEDWSRNTVFSEDLWGNA